jgi:hypothetical protein
MKIPAVLLLLALAFAQDQSDLSDPDLVYRMDPSEDMYVGVALMWNETLEFQFLLDEFIEDGYRWVPENWHPERDGRYYMLARSMGYFTNYRGGTRRLRRRNMGDVTSNYYNVVDQDYSSNQNDFPLSRADVSSDDTWMNLKEEFELWSNMADTSDFGREREFPDEVAALTPPPYGDDAAIITDKTLSEPARRNR